MEDFALPNFKTFCTVVTKTTDSWQKTDTWTSGVNREPRGRDTGVTADV